MVTSHNHADAGFEPDADLLEGLTGAEKRKASVAYRRLHSGLDRAFRRQLTQATSDVDSWVNRVMAVAEVTQHRFDEQVGPFYDTSGLRSWTGTSRQAISGQVQRGSIIACQLEDGGWVYPVWQFNEDGSTKRPLIDVWRALRGPSDSPHADRWTCALWMRAPHPALDGYTPEERVNGGGSLDEVLALAHDIGQRWAS